MNINQSVLANAVINITGNTRGLDYAINQTRKQMQGFLVFANAMGGKVGGLLANGLAMGAAGPVLNSVLGQGLGGKASGFLKNAGLLSDPMKDVADAMDLAKRRFQHATYVHKLAGLGISQGNVFQGQLLSTPMDVKRARLQHSMAAPKMETFTQGIVAGAAGEGQKLAMLFGKLGLVVAVAVPVFKKLLEAGAELEQKMRRADRVFGSRLNAAMSGYGGIGSNMSAAQYVASVSGIGQEFTGNGVGSKQSSAMSSSLARRASQIAEAWGAEFEDVAKSMQEAIGGSETAMKKFGVVLTEDIVRAYAFNNGMIKLHEHMSEAVAAQARYNLILSQTNGAATKGTYAVFSLSEQWRVFTSNVETSISALGYMMSPVAAAALGATNALGSLIATLISFPVKFGGGIGAKIREFMFGPKAEADPEVDKQAMLAQADNDSKRADDILRRERARQSSNVGYHRPEDFYQHIQKGIFGDPTEFAKRQADLLAKLLIVNGEQLKALQDFGYKVTDGRSLIQP
jgi:hypothetical protein